MRGVTRAGCGWKSRDRCGVIYSGHVINRLAEIRKSRGVPAVDLAAQAGVTRQAIYAIEGGTYVPNTTVALRLARALETSVEALFALDPPGSPATELRRFELLDGDAVIGPGEPIQICQVGKFAIGVPTPMFPAYLPVADGIVSDISRDTGLAAVAGESDGASRLLIA